MRPLERLRTATQAAHERLHVHPVTSALISRSLTQGQYILALWAFERFHEAVEGQYSSAAPGGPSQRQSPVLRQDLHALNAANNPLPPCPNLGLAPSTDALFGMMYVVEGSKLGSQMIAKNIHERLGHTQSHGAAFFHGSGKATARHWKTFLATLDEKIVDADACARAAQQTFECLEAWMWDVFKHRDQPGYAATE